MSELEVQGLVKRYGTNLVVDNVSFHVDEGEFFVLLGPSGGGKTTILRIISGLEPADAGRIILGGQDITRMTPRQRNLGMVFQDYGLYPSMNVFGNVAYGLEARNMPRPEIEKRVKAAADMLHLTPLLQRNINDLSGGEQQRVALARILAKDADLFLFDEPLSNLDPKLRYQARRDIVTVHRTKKRPSIYVTHDQTEAFAIADRIAVMAGGHLQQVGIPDELIQSPANLFMARFIGTPPMNILPGQLIHKDLAYVVNIDGREIPLPPKWNRTLEQHKQSHIALGIPPSAILPQWFLNSTENEPYVMSAEILDVEPLIGEIIVTLKLSDNATFRALFQEGDEAFPEVGDNIKIGIDTQTLNLFDPESELAIKAE